jgi:nicotinamidase/pyrazinamidase
MNGNALFWDVDTQYDFMMPDGRLYVKGAQEIIPVVSRLRTMALDGGCSIIASMDWHREDNPEISDDPDFRVTFPPHCMAGSRGARRVGSLGDLPLDTIDLDPRSPAELAGLLDRDQFHIEIHKDTLDVFSNPNTVALLELLPARPEQIVVFGVALDFCVKRALEGLARFCDVQLVLVSDATHAIDPAAGQHVIEEFEHRGGHVTERRRLREMAPCG